MGGAIQVPGNLGDGGVFQTNNKTAEWNIFVDPLAARIVFRSRIPILLVPLDATNKVPIDLAFLREFQAHAVSPLGRVAAQVLGDRSRNDPGKLLLCVGSASGCRAAPPRSRPDPAVFTSIFCRIRRKTEEPFKLPVARMRKWRWMPTPRDSAKSSSRPSTSDGTAQPCLTSTTARKDSRPDP